MKMLAIGPMTRTEKRILAEFNRVNRKALTANQETASRVKFNWNTDSSTGYLKPCLVIVTDDLTPKDVWNIIKRRKSNQ